MLKQVFAPASLEPDALPNPICDPLLRDTLSRVADIDAASLQTVLQNICSFVEVVHHQGYSFETIVCMCFTLQAYLKG